MALQIEQILKQTLPHKGVVPQHVVDAAISCLQLADILPSLPSPSSSSDLKFWLLHISYDSSWLDQYS